MKINIINKTLDAIKSMVTGDTAQSKIIASAKSDTIDIVSTNEIAKPIEEIKVEAKVEEKKEPVIEAETKVEAKVEPVIEKKEDDVKVVAELTKVEAAPFIPAAQVIGYTPKKPRKVVIDNDIESAISEAIAQRGLSAEAAAGSREAILAVDYGIKTKTQATEEVKVEAKVEPIKQDIKVEVKEVKETLEDAKDKMERLEALSMAFADNATFALEAYKSGFDVPKAKSIFAERQLEIKVKTEQLKLEENAKQIEKNKIGTKPLNFVATKTDDKVSIKIEDPKVQGSTLWANQGTLTINGKEEQVRKIFMTESSLIAYLKDEKQKNSLLKY